MNFLENTNYLNQRFDSIQALRGIAALFIVFQHISFIDKGAFGVVIFFLISGFIIMYTTEKSSNHFLVKRLIRIVPFYYLMIFFTYLIAIKYPQLFDATSASPIYLIKSLLFIPYDIDGVVQPILRVGWTVNLEILFYVVFFISMKISHKYRGIICMGIMAVMFVAGIFIPESMVVLNFWTDYHLLYFIVGIASYYLFGYIYVKCEKKIDVNKSTKFMIGLGLTIITIVMIMILGHKFIFSPDYFMAEIIVQGIPCLVLFISWFVAGLFIKVPRFFVFIGNISFSLYLVHYYPMRVLNKINHNSTRVGLIGLSIYIVAICLVIGVAYICYQLIEKKLSDRLKRLLID